MIIDTHTHIYLPEFNEDLEQIVARARELNIVKVILPNIDADSISALHRVSNAYADFCLPMMGLHPCSVQDDPKGNLSLIEKHLNERQYIGVGEIGLDLYWRKDNLKQQVEALKRQFDLAIEMNLPVSIHCRDASTALLEVLRAYKGRGLKGAWHCFTGTIDEGLEACDLGLHLGVGGVLTYKNAGLAEVFPHLPLERLLLETDAPYLSPTPKRGKRNEPAFIVHTLNRLAEILGKTLGEIEARLFENSVSLFQLDIIR